MSFFWGVGLFFVFVCLFVADLFVCLSARVSVCWFICLFVCFFVCLLGGLFVCLFVFCLLVCLFVCFDNVQCRNTGALTFLRHYGHLNWFFGLSQRQVCNILSVYQFVFKPLDNLITSPKDLTHFIVYNDVNKEVFCFGYHWQLPQYFVNQPSLCKYIWWYEESYI